eukprot:jgi/Botrbrau1/4373/Bobra.105_2s0019.1
MNRVQAAVLLFAAATLVVSGAVHTDGVVNLTKKTYDEAVADGKLWFVKYFAPWCGHCKKLAPAWKDLADHYRGDNQVNIAHVDCTAEKDICSSNEIRGYPTLKVVFNGQEHKSYLGQRDLESLKKFVDETKGELFEETAGEVLTETTA